MNKEEIDKIKKCIIAGYDLDIITQEEMSILWNYINKIANDEVEIPEEEKKIPEKLSTWFSLEMSHSKELNREYANTNFENMYDKINEIIDYLKSKGDE